MLSVWHTVGVVHTWRARINPRIGVSCNCFAERLEETLIHKFYSCS